MSDLAARDISLYVPVRNAARTLRATLASIAAQSLQPADTFLVVDFRSTDESVEIARESGMRIVEQREGRLGHARNLAIEACKTPWLASCDSDVTLERDWLAKLASRASERVAIVGGCTNERIFTDGDRWRAVNLPHNWGPAAFDNPFMLVSEMLARVSALRCVGGYRADLQSWEDSDCCQRVRQAGYTLRYEPGAVAWHDRRDSIEQVLDLRWFYASYRQRARLESLSGLVEKLAVNRAYCLQSLSQTIHSEYPQVAAASVMLWFHHIVHDLCAALRQWPLLAVEQCETLSSAALTAALGVLDTRWGAALAPMSRVLPRSVGEASARMKQAERPGRMGEWLADQPGFATYCNAVSARTAEFLSAIPAEVRELVADSGTYLTDAAAAKPVRLVDWGSTEADRRSLRSQSLEPAWHWPGLRARLESVGIRDLDSMTIVEWGRSLGVERPALRGEDVCAAAGRAGTCSQERSPYGASDSPRLAVLPHLECFSDPRGTLRSALVSARVAIIGYRTPAFFLPGVPILTARDIASICAAAGFSIHEFYTEASRTVLAVESAGMANSDETSEIVTAHAV
ncbi:MAG: glycosyltransferase family 2 protein [Phycisphaerales bacterium]|nr:glycosyltransferase family 2 protein [Phycisphaerales bacterium]